MLLNPTHWTLKEKKELVEERKVGGYVRDNAPLHDGSGFHVAINS